MHPLLMLHLVLLLHPLESFPSARLTHLSICLARLDPHCPKTAPFISKKKKRNCAFSCVSARFCLYHSSPSLIPSLISTSATKRAIRVSIAYRAWTISKFWENFRIFDLHTLKRFSKRSNIFLGISTFIFFCTNPFILEITIIQLPRFVSFVLLEKEQGRF